MSDMIIEKSLIKGTPSFIASKSLVQRGIFTEFLFNGGKRLDFFKDYIYGKDVALSVEAMKGLLSGRSEVNCGDNATLLRMLLPVRLFLGEKTRYILSQRLFERGNGQIFEILEGMGAKISICKNNISENFVSKNNDAEASVDRPDILSTVPEKYDRCVIVDVDGRFIGEEFSVDGTLTSQVVSGFLLGGAASGRHIRINLLGGRSSLAYAEMTAKALELWGFACKEDNGGFTVCGKADRIPSVESFIENDWSHNANWLVLGALCGEVSVARAAFSGFQGDEGIFDVLKNAGIDVFVRDNTVTVIRTEKFGGFECNANDNPDIIPVLCVLAAFADGKTVIKGMKRLSYKESDRFDACCRLLASCGCSYEVTEDTLEINPDGVACVRKCKGSRILFCNNDHRIAMAGAILGAKIGNYMLKGFDCTGKSSVGFYDDFKALGGKYRIED